MKILVATEKPFAKQAVDGIKDIVEKSGNTFALLENYTDKQQLLDAVADVDAVIIRSDKVTAEVLDAAKNLKIVVRAGAGYDNVDLEAATKKGVVVMNTPGQTLTQLLNSFSVFWFSPLETSTTENQVRNSKAKNSVSWLSVRSAETLQELQKVLIWKFMLTMLSVRKKLSNRLALKQLIIKMLCLNSATSYRFIFPQRLKPNSQSTTLFVQNSKKAESLSTPQEKRLSTKTN